MSDTDVQEFAFRFEHVFGNLDRRSIRIDTNFEDTEQANHTAELGRLKQLNVLESLVIEFGK